MRNKDPRKTIEFTSHERDDLALNQAKVLRAIESLKARGEEVSPFNVAQDLELPLYFIYSNLNILSQIYRHSNKCTGADDTIKKLLEELKIYQKKIKILTKKLEQSHSEVEKSFSEGFSKGASVNYSRNTNKHMSEQQIHKLSVEMWARGILFLGMEDELTAEKIKKSYRSLVTCLHPDQSGRNTDSFIRGLKEASELLLSLL